MHSRYIVQTGNTGKIICRTKETGSHIIRIYEMGADLLEEIKVKSLTVNRLTAQLKTQL